MKEAICIKKYKHTDPKIDWYVFWLGSIILNI